MGATKVDMGGGSARVVLLLLPKPFFLRIRAPRRSVKELQRFTSPSTTPAALKRGVGTILELPHKHTVGHR